MAKYVGQEHTMYLKICKKYNVQPEPEISAGGGKITLIRFFDFFGHLCQCHGSESFAVPGLAQPQAPQGPQAPSAFGGGVSSGGLGFGSPSGGLFGASSAGAMGVAQATPFGGAAGFGAPASSSSPFGGAMSSSSMSASPFGGGENIGKPDLLGKLEKWTVDAFTKPEIMIKYDKCS
jgi:hypothetical protein